MRCSKIHLPAQQGKFTSLAWIDYTSFLDKQTNKKQFSKRFSNIQSEDNSTEEKEKKHIHEKAFLYLKGKKKKKQQHLLSVLDKIYENVSSKARDEW